MGFKDLFMKAIGKSSDDEETKKAMESYEKRLNVNQPSTTTPNPRETTVDEDIENIQNRQKRIQEKTKRPFR